MNLRTGVQKTEDDTSMIWEDVGGKKSDVPFSLGSEIAVNVIMRVTVTDRGLGTFKLISKEHKTQAIFSDGYTQALRG